MNAIQLVLVLSALFIGLGNFLNGQSFKGLYVLNEGRFGEKGEVGYIDYTLQQPTYQLINFIEPFGSMLYAKDNAIFAVGGDGTIYRYSRWPATGSIDSLTGANARAVAVWKDQLLVTAFTSPHFRVYDLANFQLLYTLDSTKVRNISDGIEVAGNKAFISLGYYKDSTVTVIDLVRRDTLKNIRTLFNPNSLVFRNGAIWVECLDSFTKPLRFQKIDTTTLTVTGTYHTGILSYSSGISADSDSLIYFVNSNTNSHIATFNYTTGYVDSFRIKSPNNYSFYGVNYHHNTRSLYLSTAPTFLDTGWVRSYNLATNRYTDSIRTAINPRAILFDEFTTTSTDNYKNNSVLISTYPNPASDILHIQSPKPIQQIEIHALDGKSIRSMVLSSNPSHYSFSILEFPDGLYLLTVRTLEEVKKQKINIMKKE